MPMPKMQATIAKQAELSGIALHSGADAHLVLKPAPEDHGIVFTRVDVDDRDNVVAAIFDNVGETMLGTTIMNEAGTKVATIEHLMAALSALNINNVKIDLNGPEIPIADGCSGMFVALLKEAGRIEQAKPRKVLRIKESVCIEEGLKKAELHPHPNGFSVRFDIDFDNPAIGQQSYDVEVSPDTFTQKIADARTFGFYKDLEMMQEMGLAKGASLDNTIAIDGESIMNEGGLKFEDEFVRHKVLDAIGDLSLAGAPIIGRFIGVRSGHAFNNALLHALFERPEAFEIIEE
jgi:UDP-3-O-[3-hydroxymyristoyl] N-acetylglucosamine deacetylase